MGLPGWPGGDPGAIHDAADAWRTFSGAITDVIDDADPAMQAAFGDWDGQAAAKFESTWNAFVKTHREAAQGANTVAKQLDDFADKLEEAHKKYEHMVEVMAATAVVGLGLSLLTGGLAGAAAGAAEAAVAGEVATLLTELGVELETAVAVATAAAETAGGAAGVAVGAAINFTIGFVLSAGGQALESELDGDGFKVEWDQAAIAGVTAAVLGPLMEGKTVPVRVAVGAGGAATFGAISQLDNLLLHGGFKEGEGFSLASVLVDAAFGGAQGVFAEGAKTEQAEEDTTQIQEMIDHLADNPDVAALIAQNPDWLDIYTTNPDILKIVASVTEPGADIAVGPEGVATVLNTVQSVVIDVKAPESLATYTQQAMAKVLVDRSRDLTMEKTKEYIKESIESEVDLAGGPHAVQQMNPAQLQQLAQRIVDGIPDAKVPVH